MKAFLAAAPYKIELVDRPIPTLIITSRVYSEGAVGGGFEKAIKDRNQIKILVTPDKKYLKS